MRKFMDKDFLLDTDTAHVLYHEHAEKMPIVDYHCHIIPDDILCDKRYNSITELWLGGDHYKWRAMRSCGVAEEYITGTAAPEEKFQKWAETVPKLIGNPLYHWTHLELQRYFDVYEPLSGKNAVEIYRHCNEILARDDMSVRGIIKKSNVKLICTTDDPVDTLNAQRMLAEEGTFSTAVVPAFRPDKAMEAGKPGFAKYMDALEVASGVKITKMNDVYSALFICMDKFEALGCRVSDHAMDNCTYAEVDEASLNSILVRARSGEPLTAFEQTAYQTALLTTLAEEYVRRDWVMQLHFGCLRNNSSLMFKKLGDAVGCDSMNDAVNADGLVRLLDKIERSSGLPKTILYSLNPNDNGMIDSVIGSFQTDSKVPGRVQHGSAWWFNDHKAGMEAQLTSLMNLGAISGFVGMLTDSRSFLSYTRHEYFRRILCGLFGRIVENGEYPTDMDLLGQIVEDICYNNAVHYFRFYELLK